MRRQAAEQQLAALQAEAGDETQWQLLDLQAELAQGSQREAELERVRCALNPDLDPASCSSATIHARSVLKRDGGALTPESCNRAKTAPPPTRRRRAQNWRLCPKP